MQQERAVWLPSRGDLAVLVPSRGRPQAAADLVARLQATTTAATALIMVVDRGDPTATEYPHAAVHGPTLPGLLMLENTVGPAEALNMAAVRYAPGVAALMYLPDSCLPVGTGWDARLLAALARHGFAHGHDDTPHLWRRPGHVAVRSAVVETLGYLVPPVMREPDVWPDVWAQWAAATDGMGVADDVVISRNPNVPHRSPQWGTRDTGWREYQRASLATDVRLLGRLAQAWRDEAQSGQRS